MSAKVPHVTYFYSLKTLEKKKFSMWLLNHNLQTTGRTFSKNWICLKNMIPCGFECVGMNRNNIAATVKSRMRTRWCCGE